MSLRFPLALLFGALFVVFVAVAPGTPEAAAAADSADVATSLDASQPGNLIGAVTPTETGSTNWVWLGVGAFIVFTVVGVAIALVGYMEATRRE